MSDEHILLAPMRAQPFHFGHEYYIHQLANMGKKVIILLNHKVDGDNPFSFSVRQKWVREFVSLHKLSNVLIPNRLPLDKRSEYLLQAEHDSFIVLTTNETDKMYQAFGFKTINHHLVSLPKPKHAESLPGFHLPISDTGRIIRARLHKNQSCVHLMSAVVEEEAHSIIHAPY